MCCRYERVHNRLAVLEVLIKEESEYIKILVGKILALKPDIVVVQRTVSGLAQVPFMQLLQRSTSCAVVVFSARAGAALERLVRAVHVWRLNCET